jgi:hypothetical protein
MPESESKQIRDFFSDSARVTQALGRAVQNALRVHKALGHSVVGWENGKVVIIPPEEIEIDESVAGPLKLPPDMIP